MDPRSVRRWAVLGTAVAALTAGALTPAVADSEPDPRPGTTAEIRRPIAPPPASSPAAAGDPAAAPTAVVDGDGIETARSARPIAPGVELTSYDRLESDKWLRVDALSVALGGTTGGKDPDAGPGRGISPDKGISVDYLHSGKVADRRTVSELAAAHDPGKGRRTVAAINADFFDINETGAPQGAGLKDGKLVQSPAPGAHRAVGFGPADAGRVLELYFDGTLTTPQGVRALTAYNAANVPAGGIGAYTDAWGTADRALTVDKATPVAEALVEDGKVVSVADRVGSGPIAAGATVLVGREAGAEALKALRPGDPVGIAYAPRTNGGPVPRTAVGGRELLVVDGVPQNHEGAGNNTAAPRTAVGFSADGRTLHILTVDGRQADSGGVTLTELGVMMKQAGAHNALNLDGGGSSTLVAREPGSDALQVENSPSDGSERTVPNGLALTAPDGSGRLEGYWVETRTPAVAAPTADPVKGGHPERVFPGLSRELTAAGYDETYGPAEGTPRWRAERADIGRVSDDGVFTARRSGTTEVRASSGSAGGSTELTVLDTLARVEPTARRVGLADAAATGTFGLVGYDAHGTSAPVEPRDVRLDYDRTKFEIRDDGRGAFAVRALTGKGAGQIKATVQGKETLLVVSVGLDEQSVAAFDDAVTWTFSHARAAGRVDPTPEGRTGTGLKLTYDFSLSTATRAAYVNPPARIPVPGSPQSFKLWIKGDGKGAWPSLHLKDGAGSDLVLRGPYVTWTGWQQVTFTVPQGTAMPLSVFRFYLAETGAAKQYTGEVVLDELTAQVPPSVDVPEQPVVTDELIDSAAETEGRDWQFAVMSDAQFVAREPDSPIVQQARRTLREIRAAAPDFLVINGDLVDEGAPADLAFARRILDEELGDSVPWYYVPGNHEVMGGKIDHFKAEFGPAQRVFDHEGTRFVTLDTSSLSLRGGGFAQIKALRTALDQAAKDPAVSSVAVIQHVPPRDPTAQKGSQLGDRKEAALLEQWLADFRRTSGKGAAFVGSHVGVFHAAHIDSVPYLINGNSGKNPAGPADRGGFTGWSLIGVDRVSRAEQHEARQRPWRGGPDWISVQTRADTDRLTLTAPQTLRPGQSGPVEATVVQGARQVPVAFPVSADWTGSPNLHIGDPDEARPRHVAAYDPDTGRLTALRAGGITLAVTVNGVTQRAEVLIASAADQRLAEAEGA
ncbi:phosphodiester glycosidase family protein [Streptomyces indicus]|uniref:Calcineurin-like phosphoesterase n=1 Tax=Streptomyces indicus TaxID=417292 RepID=A0A1G8TZU8_9ACTN|nr:phosphodiester glycosidase family protein [Streptomyces indicus]SDJ46874.1 Calcineurin-like phosphoesterase [Streptomyces indicus]